MECNCSIWLGNRSFMLCRGLLSSHSHDANSGYACGRKGPGITPVPLRRSLEGKAPDLGTRLLFRRTGSENRSHRSGGKRNAGASAMTTPTLSDGSLHRLRPRQHRRQDLSIQNTALDRDGCAIVFEEKRSGTRRAGRAQLELALKVLMKGDTLVVTRLDRLGRSLRDLANIAHDIEQAGTVVLYVTTGPPAFFQASRPPWLWQADASPASCAACSAMAERSPNAQ